MNVFVQSACILGLVFGTAMPVSALSVKLNDVTPIQLGESIEVTIASIDGNAPFTYQWIDRSGDVVGSSDVLNVTPDQPEVYELTVTDATGATAHAYAEVLVYGIYDSATFEDNLVVVDGEWHGRVYDDPAQTTSRFFSGGFVFGNFNNPAWSYWDAFAISKSTSSDFDGTVATQYNNIVGKGHSGDGFLVGNLNNYTTEGYIGVLASADGEELDGLYITNTSYLASVAKNGNQFVNAMSEGDFAKVVFKADNGNETEFYLADYRNGKNIIIDNWQFLDLSSLGKVKMLNVEVQCSNDGYPTYVCLDDISYKKDAVTDVEFTRDLHISFERGGEWLSISGFTSPAQVRIYNVAGILASMILTTESSIYIDMTALSSGVYIVNIMQADGTVSNYKVVK